MAAFYVLQPYKSLKSAMLTKEPYEGSQSSTTLLASNSENTEQHPEVDIAPITGARKIKSMQVQPEL